MTESVNTEATEQEAEPLVFVDEMHQMSHKTLSDLISKRNARVGQINAVKGDRQTLTEQVAAESDNPEIVAAREAEQEAKAAWDEAVMALHKVVVPEVDRLLSDSESSVKEIEEEVKTLDAKIKPGTTYYKKMYGEVASKHLPALARLKGFSTKGAGATGRRVRGFDVAIVIDGEVENFENFAQAAKYLDVETGTLQAEFFKAAGKDVLKEIGDRVEFDVEYTVVDEEAETSETLTAHVIATREVKDEAATESDEPVESDEDEDEDFEDEDED